jgi:hypothetical protein
MYAGYGQISYLRKVPAENNEGLCDRTHDVEGPLCFGHHVYENVFTKKFLGGCHRSVYSGTAGQVPEKRRNGTERPLGIVLDLANLFVKKLDQLVTK